MTILDRFDQAAKIAVNKSSEVQAKTFGEHGVAELRHGLVIKTRGRSELYMQFVVAHPQGGSTDEIVTGEPMATDRVVPPAGLTAGSISDHLVSLIANSGDPEIEAVGHRRDGPGIVAHYYSGATVWGYLGSAPSPASWFKSAEDEV